ncbi:cytochrome P450 6a2-like isoform X1 [Vespa crabro]|uniref:cytochrome P450 6a2-like isoform X1 n=1 Tax=Vespa crabro TaxID=7445 RepID=UPI001F000876|nr:cytochrome P450 6a2-like isoform X1 [Vespa crabro]XP_046823343.1 cytochrome P450 6a2-like isoform X1 [Vespa crabro]
MEGIFEILCGLTVIILLLYYYLTMTFDYWKVRDVKGPQPIPLFGNMKDIIFHKINMTEYLINIYNFYKDERYIGIFFRSRPILILRDPQLIKNILIRDFSSFPQRAVDVTEKVEPLTQNLIYLDAHRWRPLRNKLTPAFSINKMKGMFPLIMTSSLHFEEYINKIPDNDIMDIYKLFNKFTINIIGNCVFGIEIDVIKDEENDFSKIIKEIFKDNLMTLVKYRLQLNFPKLYNELGFLFRNSRQISFFLNIVNKTMKYRIENNIVRNDFINVLMELKKNPEKLSDDIELTDTFYAAQAYVFFAAGSETSSLTMTFILYELAQNQNIQDKVRKEINDEYERNDGTLKFESIKTLKYLQAVFKETLRKHPPVIFLSRECVVPSYKLEGTKITIGKHQRIFIPVIALHKDPNIYPNPNVFDPTRFITENNLINDGTYLPFGRGPRNCIGEKFAEYQVIIGLAIFLRNHKVDICEKTKIPYTIGRSDFLLQPKEEIYLKIKVIEK